MTITIAITGKSGSGKTTVVKSLVTALQAHYPEKSILLVDNDLSCDLSNAFGIRVKNTINNLRIENYHYRIPEKVRKHELIEWAINDLTVNLYDDIDIIVAGPVATKGCTCITDKFIDDALADLIKNYDIVIFDCEYDLEYLNKLVDYPLDTTLIIADTSISSIYSASKIKESSHRFAAQGQLGVIINKVRDNRIPENVAALLVENDMKIIGMLPYDENLEYENLMRDSEILTQAVDELLFKLNLSILGS
ncbi:MAG TPA: AAA family ATPase [Candidatus Gastranaerophilales bacterium]|nr:AAA family ATPase [Candidatus Gastranaerophilales bacterium]